MAPLRVKQEYVAEYVHGMGSQFFLIRAVSAEQVRDEYPLFDVCSIDESSLPEGRIEVMRMYPGEGRPLDHAVKGRSSSDREMFVAAAIRQRDEALQRYLSANFPIPDSEQQYWVDLDDDADFRMQMHELWKNDPRYLELPPERRLL